MSDKSVPELSRCVRVGEFTAKGRVLKVKATPDECAALAHRFGLVSMDSLEAELTIKDGGQQGVVIDGQIRALLSQPCVATGTAVKETIDEGFRLRLVGAEDLAIADEEEYYLDPEADDLDLLEGDSFDAGEIVAQSLALMLNPYPRAEGVSLKDLESALVKINEGPLERPNPFAALSSLKDKP